MGITIRNLILAQVEDRADFLKHLIIEYPNLLKDWTERTDEVFKQNARDDSEGDPEICSSLYSSSIAAFDENDFRKDMFYKSMLIMVYSYYEGIIEFLVRDTKSDDWIDVICSANNIKLSDKAQEAKEKIKSGIRIVRNNLTHNNIKATRNISSLKDISREWSDVQFADGKISITGPDFILEYLKLETLVLKELCEKLGYTHQKVGQINNTNYGRKQDVNLDLSVNKETEPRQ